MLAEDRFEDRGPLGSLGRALDHARRSYPNLSLTELTTVIVIAENQGLTVTSLALVCGFTVATASRTVRGLAEPGSPGVLPPARGLARLLRGPDDDRSRHAFLTPEGERLCIRLGRILAC